MKKAKAFSLGFIGGGRIARVILGGLANKNCMPEEVIVGDSDTRVLEKLAQKFPAAVCIHNGNQKAAAADMVFFALHPPAMGNVLEEIAARLQPHAVFVSLPRR